MSVIVPTVLAENAHQYREQVERISEFAKRIHIDFTDGIFAKSKTLPLDKAWLPEDMIVDIHVMHALPGMESKELIALKPHLVVVHAEAEGNFVILADKLHKHGIKIGVALLPETDPRSIKKAIKHVDHVLIFSGDLGHFGGKADLNLLHKISQIRKLKHSVEIGWDGGINEENVAQIAKSGVDVLNAGGAIQRSEDPAASYAHLQSLLH